MGVWSVVVYQNSKNGWVANNGEGGGGRGGGGGGGVVNRWGVLTPLRTMKCC